MLKKSHVRLTVKALFIIIAALVLTNVSYAAVRIDLASGWSLQSSARISGPSGLKISQGNYSTKGWYAVSVPCTVIGGLLQNNVYPDPYYSKNVNKINANDFKNSWWYRTTFKLPSSENGKRVWLNFQGISYQANIFLNGKKIADTSQIVGTFREYEIDITSNVLYNNQPNVLAVELFRPAPSDLRLWFSDWITMELPDKSMGLFNPVFIMTSGPVTVRHPLVISNLNPPALDTAQLSVVAEVTNASASAVSGTLQGTITGPTGPILFSQNISLVAHERSRRITLSAANFPQLKISKPAIWWPWQMGQQNLYSLNLRFYVNGQQSDSLSARFGIRQMTSKVDASGHRLFMINGKNFLVRGAAWAPDMFLKWDLHRQQQELRYVRDLNMNTIRLEGKLMNDAFFDLCDQSGIVVLAGWMYGDGWEEWSTWNGEDYATAYASLTSQIYRLRNHPCILAWLNGSDNHPPIDVERQYLKIENDLQWPNPIVSHAGSHHDDLTGVSGVKMNGPYDWEPPNYWVTDAAPGGAWGFNTEVCPGGAVPPIESLKKMLPSDHLWPIDDYWDYHSCGNYYTLDVFTDALNSRYGNATSAQDYAEKAQLAAYESHRAMFEAFGRSKYWATGTIQWMLNNPWPSMMWHLYDYYLRPGGSYFGAKIACEALHIQYSYDDRSIVIVDSDYTRYTGLQATADVYNLDDTLKFHKSITCDIGADGVSKIFRLPVISGLTKTYFLRLTLKNSAGKVVSVNSYWLSTKSDVLDLNAESQEVYVTLCKSYADLTGLQSLPKVKLNTTSRIVKSANKADYYVTVTNKSSSIAVGVHLKINKGSTGEELLPILWSDNYFLLLPGESREVRAEYLLVDLGKATPAVQVDCYNNICSTAK